jgi:hypothetical protein
MARTTEVTFEAENDAGAPALELDVSRRLASANAPRFVTGAATSTAAVPEVVPCPYCGATGWAVDHAESCAHCGAPVRGSLAVASPTASAPLLPATPPSVGEAVADAVADVPFAFWKRLPVYAFLAMLLGNGCLCGGLSGRSNAALALLVIVGVVGVVMSLQRRP